MVLMHLTALQQTMEISDKIRFSKTCQICKGYYISTVVKFFFERRNWQTFVVWNEVQSELIFKWIRIGTKFWYF